MELTPNDIAPVFSDGKPYGNKECVFSEKQPGGHVCLYDNLWTSCSLGKPCVPGLMRDLLEEKKRTMKAEARVGREIKKRKEAVRERDAALKEIEDGRMIWDVIADVCKDVPEEEWDKIPSDLAENLRHYLYGEKKK